MTSNSIFSNQEVVHESFELILQAENIVHIMLSKSLSREIKIELAKSKTKKLKIILAKINKQLKGF